MNFLIEDEVVDFCRKSLPEAYVDTHLDGLMSYILGRLLYKTYLPLKLIKNEPADTTSQEFREKLLNSGGVLYDTNEQVITTLDKCVSSNRFDGWKIEYLDDSHKIKMVAFIQSDAYYFQQDLFKINRLQFSYRYPSCNQNFIQDFSGISFDINHLGIVQQIFQDFIAMHHVVLKYLQEQAAAELARAKKALQFTEKTLNQIAAPYDFHVEITFDTPKTYNLYVRANVNDKCLLCSETPRSLDEDLQNYKSYFAAIHQLRINGWFTDTI